MTRRYVVDVTVLDYGGDGCFNECPDDSASSSRGLRVHLGREGGGAAREQGDTGEYHIENPNNQTAYEETI